ncbi:MAG: acetate uptake transporter family protein [Pseudonocardia sp.]|nr:acetate uptake transporter family protein [Pseudonocardia sp.]
MSVESDTAGAHAAAEAPPAPPAPNVLTMGLITFIPGGMILGLWFVGYLPTSALPGGMIPIVLACTGLYELIATIVALRAGQNAVAAVFAIFSSFWISFGVLLLALNNGWIIDATTAGAITSAQSFQIQAAYLLSYAVTFVMLSLFTLRLPLVFTTAIVLVTITFVLAYLGVALGATGLFPIAGIVTFLFTAIFAYICFDSFNQDLGGRAMSMGSPIQT